MILILEVMGPEGAKLGTARRKVFNAAGGTIGRLRDNAWSLPDPHVSNRHAVIRYQDGGFYIEDTSMNGVFINASDNRLVKGQLHPIQSNDWIFMEPYEIRAVIQSEAREKVTPSPFEDLFQAPPPVRPTPVGKASVRPDAPSELIPGSEEVDPLKALGFGPQRPQRPEAPKAADLARGSVVSDHYHPPSSRVPPPPPVVPPPPARAPVIPADYNPMVESDDTSAGFDATASPPPPGPAAAAREVEWPTPPTPTSPPPGLRSAAPKPAALPVTPAAALERPGGAPSIDVADVLRGAGLDPAAITPELAENIGRILRVVVGGVMDVLQARQRIKSEFRMDMTTFRPADNNPLKFSANVDDALHNLLVKRNAAYLAPVEAFEDAFGDVRNHQMAMLAGLRVAFEAMLGQFDPARLQEEFDRQLKKGSRLAVPAKFRYWDLYCEKIHDMVRDPDASFRELFGDEFANAYEEQLKRLQTRGRGVEP